MLGASILVQPVTAIDLATTNVYLPADDEGSTAYWYDLHTAARHVSAPGARVLEGFEVHPDRTLTLTPALTLARTLTLTPTLTRTLTPTPAPALTLTLTLTLTL